MSGPIWLTEEEVQAINENLVARFGGLQGGVRDENLFKAALARPLNKWAYEPPEPDLFTLAAAYCFGISRGHVFHDGNKRTAYVAAITFLQLNDLNCTPDQTAIVSTMVRVAEGSLSEESLAEWFRTTTRGQINEQRMEYA